MSYEQESVRSVGLSIRTVPLRTRTRCLGRQIAVPSSPCRWKKWEVVAQCLRHWTTDQDVVSSHPRTATARPLSKVLNPQLLGCVNELNVSRSGQGCLPSSVNVKNVNGRDLYICSKQYGQVVQSDGPNIH